jgi:DNA topoisomerase-1
MEAAEDAGLRYVGDDRPGIARRRRGTGFMYSHADGRTVRDPATLSRIRSLAIPPAWDGVWICPDPDGHIQATGRDAKGRKQYRYHPRWRSVRDSNKYDRMAAFGRLLPRIRRRVERDVALPGLGRDKILAAVVRLLEVTLIRVGNDEYARRNESFGLATMRDRHVSVNGSALRFEFRGKSGVRHAIDCRDRRLATIVRRSRDLPGYELFQYIDAQGVRRSIDAADVNDYLRSAAGAECTAKDFRTWAGTLSAFRALRRLPQARTQAEAKRRVAQCITSVAERLGNTKAVCRTCYIHPDVLAAYLEGSLPSAVRSARSGLNGDRRDWSEEEAALSAFLERRRSADHAEAKVSHG